MGKTTLLRQLQEKLHADFATTRILPVFCDPGQLDKNATPTDFFKLLLEETIKAVNKKFSRSISLVEIELPVYFENDLINDFVAPVLDEIRRQVPSPYFHFLWMVDDIGELVQYSWSRSVFSLLRALLYSSRKMNEILLLLSGTPRAMEDVVTAQGSPLGNIMQIHYLDVLNSAESRSLILRELAGSELAEDIVLEIIRQTGGQPYLLQSMLKSLRNNVSGKITTRHVLNAGKTFCRKNPLFAAWFKQFSETDRQIYQALLASKNPLPRSFFNQFGTPFLTTLRPLTLLGVIQPTDDKKFYQLNIEMFTDWVREHGYFS